MKKIVSLLLVLAMVLTLAACGSKPATETTKAPEAPADTTAAAETPAEGKKYEGVELTYWSMWNSAEPQGQVIQEVVAAFEEQTGAKVNVEWKGRELNTILSASLEAKEKIDLFDDDYQRIANVYPNVADLTDMAAAAGYKGYECINNQVIEWVGHLNSIVEQPQVGGVFYDTDAFAKAGIETPPATWAEFLDACEKLKAVGIAPQALDTAYTYFTFYHQLVRHLGEDKIEELALNGGWSNEPGAVAAAQEVVDYVKAGNLVDGAPDEYPSSQNKVGFGQAAMVVCGNYVTAEVDNNCGVKLNWGLLNYPAVEGGVDNVSAYGGANSLAITDYSENKQAAFDFIMMMVTGEFDQKMADTAAQIPADPTNTCSALPGAVETLLASDSLMSWCGSLNANSDLSTNFKALATEIFEGKYESGEAFCAAMDALY